MLSLILVFYKILFYYIHIIYISYYILTKITFSNTVLLSTKKKKKKKKLKFIEIYNQQ